MGGEGGSVRSKSDMYMYCIFFALDIYESLDIQLYFFIPPLI